MGNSGESLFTSTPFLETRGRLGITHRRTAYHHPEANRYSERFHRSWKEEQAWVVEDRSLQEARTSIRRWTPHGVGNQTPHETFSAFATYRKNQALTV